MIWHEFSSHRLKTPSVWELKTPFLSFVQSFLTLVSRVTDSGWALDQSWKVCSILLTAAFYSPPCRVSLLTLVFVVPSFHPSRCFPGNRTGSCFTWSQSQAPKVLHWLIPMGVAPLNNQKHRAREGPFLPLHLLLARLPKAINNKAEN